MEKGNWITLPEAAELFGYGHVVSLRNRLRQLRERGLVQDLGNPPSEYTPGAEPRPVRVYWVNPLTMLLDSTAPAEFFSPKRGRRWA
ncbi:MAG: hypothetical protein KF698_08395 [Anaerolineales bacterium]|nr:hypothetical protein [Anaerolineales bacterium]